MILLFLLVCVVLVEVSRSVALTDEGKASLQAYLQNEALLLAEAQQQITKFLLSKNIPIKSGHLTREERQLKKEEESKDQVRVCESTEENEVECRISLDRVEIGKKCIAPCGCGGSQRWIQFSEFNRLRRKEPSKWITCQTCQQKFDYSILDGQISDVKVHVISTLLDKPVILRSILGLVFLVLSATFRFDQLMLRLLTSRFFWQRVGVFFLLMDHNFHPLTAKWLLSGSF